MLKRMNFLVLLVFIGFICCESNSTKSEETNVGWDATWRIKVYESGSGQGLDNVKIRFNFTDDWDKGYYDYTNSDGILIISRKVTTDYDEESSFTVNIKSLFKEGYVLDRDDTVWIGKVLDRPDEGHRVDNSSFYLRKE